jgi:hypothetical protein
MKYLGLNDGLEALELTINALKMFKLPKNGQEVGFPG